MYIYIYIYIMSGKHNVIVDSYGYLNSLLRFAADGFKEVYETQDLDLCGSNYKIRYCYTYAYSLIHMHNI